MADYNREIMQALREIAQEMRGLRKAVEGIDRRLATSGGLTNALTRRAHLVEYDGNAYCSACGALHGVWLGDADKTLDRHGEACKYCNSVFSGEAVES